MATYHPHRLLPPSFSVPSYPTSLVFDPFADLLWAGSSSGHVQSFSSPSSFARNVAFPAHGATVQQGAWAGMGKGGVKEMMVGEREIVTLGDKGLGGRKRGGLVKWGLSEGATSLSSMCVSPTNASEIIAGGAQPHILVVNTHTGTIVRQVDSLSNLLYYRRTPRFVASGSADGVVRFHDPRSAMKTEQSFSAHLGGLTGLDTSGWNVMTTGYTVMQGHPLPDPMVKIFDVRTMKALPPVPFANGPAFVLVHPQNTSSLVISSSQGTIQVTDIDRPGESEFLQLDVSSFVTAAAISTSGDYLAFGDAEGNTHVWSTDHAGSTFNGYGGVEQEWADPVEPPTAVAWATDTPLNMIGMPHYSTPLLSNLSDSIYHQSASSPFFHPPPKIPSSVSQSIRTVDFVGYSPTPKELKGTRNRVPSSAGAGRKGTGPAGMGIGKRRISEPRFRSEREREALRKGGNVPQATMEMEAGQNAADAEMAKYRKVEIKYSKFGVEDFDFGFYNTTRYSGLETHIANSYTNSVLQALHYTQPFRTVAKSHLSTPCPKEHCLLCEAGFLFRMLEDAQGTNCQASNFSRAFGATPQAMSLGLFDAEESAAPKPYAALVQSLTRFLLELMATEANTYGTNPSLAGHKIGPAPSTVSQVCGLDLVASTTCLTCGFVANRNVSLHTVELVYPRKALSNEVAVARDFPSILRASISRDSTAKAVCVQCKQYSPVRNRRALARGAALPPIFTITAGVHTAEIMEEFWAEKQGGKNFLGPKFRVATGDGDEFKISTDGEGPADATYELRALVVEIQAGSEERHLVSIVKIPVDELDQDAASPWFVFNDFLVTNVSEREALSFAGDFKTPAVIIYERTDSNAPLDLDSLPMGIDPSILSRDVSIAWHRNPDRIKHRSLTAEELPSEGTLVAIDAEFVSMQLDELEYRSDGTKKVVRPSRLSLARVSVLRGSGPAEEVPFIDDHIHTSEPVVDYLTDFSGIHNGDLDPHVSQHTLVPLKVAYKKLRLLLDLGCVFIGHGLKKDFRIINIFVPTEQVCDTVELFYNPLRQRKISLRFLSWFLLKNDIQTGEHDSIEDARSALQLFKLYLKFEEDGRLDDVMDDIFAEGKRLNWKPPGAAPPAATITGVADSTPTHSLVSTPEPHHAVPAPYSSLSTSPPPSQPPSLSSFGPPPSSSGPYPSLPPSPMRRLPNGPPFYPRSHQHPMQQQQQHQQQHPSSPPIFQHNNFPPLHHSQPMGQFGGLPPPPWANGPPNGQQGYGQMVLPGPWGARMAGAGGAGNVPPPWGPGPR